MSIQHVQNLGKNWAQAAQHALNNNKNNKSEKRSPDKSKTMLYSLECGQSFSVQSSRTNNKRCGNKNRRSSKRLYKRFQTGRKEADALGSRNVVNYSSQDVSYLTTLKKQIFLPMDIQTPLEESMANRPVSYCQYRENRIQFKEHVQRVHVECTLPTEEVKVKADLVIAGMRKKRTISESAIIRGKENVSFSNENQEWYTRPFENVLPSALVLQGPLYKRKKASIHTDTLQFGPWTSEGIQNNNWQNLDPGAQVKCTVKNLDAQHPVNIFKEDELSNHTILDCCIMYEDMLSNNQIVLKDGTPIRARGERKLALLGEDKSIIFENSSYGTYVNVDEGELSSVDHVCFEKVSASSDELVLGIRSIAQHSELLSIGTDRLNNNFTSVSEFPSDLKERQQKEKTLDISSSLTFLPICAAGDDLRIQDIILNFSDVGGQCRKVLKNSGRQYINNPPHEDGATHNVLSCSFAKVSSDVDCKLCKRVCALTMEHAFLYPHTMTNILLCPKWSGDGRVHDTFHTYSTESHLNSCEPMDLCLLCSEDCDCGLLKLCSEDCDCGLPLVCLATGERVCRSYLQKQEGC